MSLEENNTLQNNSLIKTYFSKRKNINSFFFIFVFIIVISSK